MQNPVNPCILNIYEFENILLSSFLFCTQLKDFKYFYLTWIILYTINHIFAKLFDLVGFYSILTIVGYLMQNPVYIYVSNMISKHILLQAWAHFFACS